MALAVVLSTEGLIRLRRRLSLRAPQPSVVMAVLDLFRLGFLYGLFLEAFKLI